METAMQGPSIFDEVDDDYVDPGMEVDTVESREMDAMMNQYLDQMGSSARQGELVNVPVVAVKEDHVLVDVGDKSEGIIGIREFPFVGDKPMVKVGDVIEAVVRGFDAVSGLVNLSYQEARRRRAMKDVEEAFKKQTPLKGVVTRTVKGGLIIDIGTTAFVPASQIDLHRVDDYEQWVGQEIEGIIIELVPEKRRIVVSRRRLLEQQRDQARHEVMGKLAKGQTLDVTVRRVVDFGAFVDLGGLDGLIPRSEISWQRNARPEDYLKPGESLTAVIVEIDEATAKVTLSRRLAMGNPWETAVERYGVGSVINGKVVSLTAYGAFVRLEEGLDGMVHVSDMAWESAGKKPGEFLSVGQEVSASVLSVDPQAQRISLGLKQLTKDPWENIEEHFPKGKRFTGPVTGLTKYGAFVELEPGIEGMVHVTDFSWDKRINQPRDVVKKGDVVEVCVLEIDRERRRISLGVKQLTESPMEKFSSQYKVGDTVEGPVTSVTEFGAFVKLEGEMEGFIHVSQLDSERVEKAGSVVKAGDIVKAKITRIDPETSKISLSRRQLLRDQERSNISAYLKTNDSGSINSMGHLLGDIVLEDDLPAQAAPAAPVATQPEAAPAEPAPQTLSESEPATDDQPAQ